MNHHLSIIKKLTDIGCRVLTLLVLLLPGCQGSDNEPEIPDIPFTPITLTEAENEAVTRNNRLAFDLLRILAAQDPDSNIFISPFGISRNIAVLANMTDGESQRNLMRFTGFNDSIQMNNYFRKMQKALLDADNKIRPRLASSLWLKDGTSLPPSVASFLDNVGTKIFNVNPTIDNSVAINRWIRSVADNGLLCFNEVGLGNLSVADAAYFEGNTLWPFYRTDLCNHFWTGPSTKHGAKIYATPNWDFPLGVNDNSCVYNIEFGNRSYVMSLVTTRSYKIPIDSLIADIEPEDVLQPDSIHMFFRSIAIPTFVIKYNASIVPVLKKLGLATDTSVKGQPEQNEENAIPDNMLSIAGMTLSEENIRPHRMAKEEPEKATRMYYYMETVNQPFIIVIREKSTNAIVYIGVLKRLLQP